jgi:hypothetical protein
LGFGSLAVVRTIPPVPPCGRLGDRREHMPIAPGLRLAVYWTSSGHRCIVGVQLARGHDVFLSLHVFYTA